MRHTLLGFLLIAMICGSKAEASYVCLEDNPDLQPCNFERMQRAPVRGDLEKKTRISNGAVMESLYQAPDGTVVIYKLEGCVPRRLPFTLPICKTEDTVGRVVEVRRLFPFVISGDPPTAPLIFPEVEAAQLYKSTGVLQEKMYNPVISRQDLNLDKETSTKVSRRKKKLNLENLKKNRKHEKTMDAEMMETMGVSSILPSLFKSKHYRRRNDIDSSEGLKKSTRSGRQFFEASLPEYEFPYARAIPYDLVQIRRLLHLPKDSLGTDEYTRHGGEFPYSQAIPFDPEKHKNLLHESEERRHHPVEVPKYFPYDEAIPYDPLKLEQLLMWVKNREDLPESKMWKREVINEGDEFPYNKAIPYNHWKVSEFRRRLEARSPGHVKE
ncbi:uncharacterized protein LOC107048551 [Diachasma alloeum]|uniref:uncharacterized protein LOC107048551 n=1 Tax=Diachasma alloeum TaxID=454923 RepID=UPI00073831BB|nr:uncharacterized protein LOC107048551 [Diachasma alloeum]